MPTYVYRCTQCGHTFEVFQRVTDERITKCEVCGGPVNKVFHPAGIVFKGSGFYVNDHGKAGKTDTAGTASTAGADSKTADAPKSDAAKSSDKSPSD